MQTIGNNARTARIVANPTSSDGKKLYWPSSKRFWLLSVLFLATARWSSVSPSVVLGSMVTTIECTRRLRNIFISAVPWLGISRVTKCSKWVMIRRNCENCSLICHCSSCCLTHILVSSVHNDYDKYIIYSISQPTLSKESSCRLNCGCNSRRAEHSERFVTRSSMVEVTSSMRTSALISPTLCFS